MVAALEGYLEAGSPIFRPAPAEPGEHRVTLPSIVSAKLAVHEIPRSKGWSRLSLAQRLGVLGGTVRRLLDLRQHTDVGAIDGALGTMGAQLSIMLPDPGGRQAA